VTIILILIVEIFGDLCLQSNIYKYNIILKIFSTYSSPVAAKKSITKTEVYKMLIMAIFVKWAIKSEFY
jgi:hypothetical protein